MEFFISYHKRDETNILFAVAKDYYHIREPLFHYVCTVQCLYICICICICVCVCVCICICKCMSKEYTCAHSIRKKKILFLVVLFCLLLAPRVLSLDLMGILNCWLYLSEHICYTFSDNHFGFFVFSSILVPMFSNRSSSQFSQQETTCLLLLKEILVCGM